MSNLPSGSGRAGGGSGSLGAGSSVGSGCDGGFFVPPFDGGEERCFVQDGHPTYCWIE